MRTTHDPTSPRCPHCLARGTVQRPSAAWRVANGASWLVAGTFVFAAGNIGPFIIPLIPVLLGSGAALISFTHERATAEPICSACGKIARPVPRPFASPTTLPLPAPVGPTDRAA